MKPSFTIISLVELLFLFQTILKHVCKKEAWNGITFNMRDLRIINRRINGYCHFSDLFIGFIVVMTKRGISILKGVPVYVISGSYP